MVYSTDSGAVVGFAAFGIEPIHDRQTQLRTPGLAVLGIVKILKSGTEGSTCPEAEFLSQSRFLRWMFVYVPLEREGETSTGPFSQ